ncbi:hypothetical protein [Vallitalea guaymasensis]|uniref:hypothetical protein n=1 Tax=Vallitalea guaymasensis TaxID=1185412 RepID=UPI000DE40C31|nr:hypothetical protein [Vallitalea guaymasensis]
MPVQTASILLYLVKNRQKKLSVIKNYLYGKDIDYNISHYETKDLLREEKIRLMRNNNFIIPKSLDDNIVLLQELKLILIKDDIIYIPNRINDVNDCFKVIDLKMIEILKNFNFIKKNYVLLYNIISNDYSISMKDISKYSISKKKLISFLDSYFKCNIKNGILVLETNSNENVAALINILHQLKKFNWCGI